MFQVTKDERLCKPEDIHEGGIYFHLLGEDPPEGITVSLFEVDSEEEVRKNVEILTQSFIDFERDNNRVTSGFVTLIRVEDRPLLIGAAASYGGLGRVLIPDKFVAEPYPLP
jgi:hypothetical protein